MALKKKEVNPNSKSLIKSGDPAYYWDNTKLKLLELLLDREMSVNELAKCVGVSRDKVLSWLNDEEFKRVYKSHILSSLNELQLRAQNYLRDLMKQLKDRVDVSIQDLKGEKAVAELREVLKLVAKFVKPDVPEKEPPREGDKVLNIFSPEVAKILEKRYLEQQGVKPLNVEKEELEQLQVNEEPSGDNKKMSEAQVEIKERKETKEDKQ